RRLKMDSRTAEKAYRTARPILMKRGPVPLSRALASQEMETPSSLATWAGCSRGSISFVFAGPFIVHFLFLSVWTLGERPPQKELLLTPNSQGRRSAKLGALAAFGAPLCGAGLELDGSARPSKPVSTRPD